MRRPMIPVQVVVVIVVIITLLVSSSSTTTANAFHFVVQPHDSRRGRRHQSSTTSLLDKPNIEVISQPDPEFLEKQGVFRWGTWGCLPGTFPWSYGENESCYLLSGQVTVTPTDGRPAATFGKGDFVTFPAGLSCEWDVTEAVQKHFKFF